MAQTNNDNLANMVALQASLAQLAGTLATNKANKDNVSATNQANKESVEATNQANKDIAAANNETSLGIFNEQMDYVKAVQQMEWNRADSTLQRTLADANAAGLSPLAALNSPNSSGSIVSQPSAPAMQSAQMIAAQQNPFLADYTFDASIAQSMLDIFKNDRTLSSNEKIKNTELTYERFRDQKLLEENVRQFDATLEQHQSEFDRSHYENIREFNRNLEFLSSKHSDEYALSMSKDMRELALSVTNGMSGAYKTYSNKDEYDAAFSSWIKGYAELLGSMRDYYDNESESSLQSQNVGGSGSLSAGGSVMGTGANGGLSISKEKGSTESSSSSKSKKTWIDMRYTQFFDKNPYPIYTGN